MGLFDSVVGAVEEKLESENPLLGAVGSLITQNGGIQGLSQKFSQGGLEGTFSSWVSNEEKQAITPDQIQKVLGSGQVNEIASKLGVDPATASTFLAQHLPTIINQLTPNGQVDPNVNHAQALMSLLPTLLQGFENAKQQQ